jgi:hypothetical protein
MAIHGIPSNKTFPSITPLDFGHNMVFEAHAGGAGQSMDYTIKHSYPENSLALGMDGTPALHNLPHLAHGDVVALSSLAYLQMAPSNYLMHPF